MVSGKTCLAAVLVSFCVQAWDVEHDVIARLTGEFLPKAVKTQLDFDYFPILVGNSHFPDMAVIPGENGKRRFHTLSELAAHTGEENARAFAECGFTTAYWFHVPKGRAALMGMLARAFATGDDKRAAFYISVLSHSVSDESALNHPPLLGFFRYSNLRGIDFSMRKVEDGAKNVFGFRTQGPVARRVRENLRRYTPSAPAGSLEEAAYAFAVAATIGHGAWSAAIEGTIAFGNRAEAETALVELVTMQIQTLEDIVWTCWVHRSPTAWLPDGTFDRKYHRLATEAVRGLDPATQSVFDGIFDSARNPAKPKAMIGLVCEAYSRLPSDLSSPGRILTAACGRTLRANGYAVKGLKYWELEKGFPDPAEVPCVLVCIGGAGYLCNGAGAPFAAAARTYRARGGKLIVVGGEDRRDVTGFAATMKRRENADVPVSSKWHRNEAADAGKMALVGTERMPRLACGRYPFYRDPNFDGFCKPVCRMETPEGTCLLELDNGRERFPVAVRNGNVVWLPEYALMPYLFVKEDPRLPLATLTLDGFGSRVLLDALEHLMPAAPADWVDMRIGTARANGSNVLGPCVPHGSVHPSPDSLWPTPHARPKGARHGFGPPTSGWWPGDKVVGFSQLHAQGTGGTPSYGIFRYVFEPDDMEILEAHPYRLRVRLKKSDMLVDVAPAPHGAVYHVRRTDGTPVVLPLNRRCKIAQDDCVNAAGEFTGHWNPTPYRCYAHDEVEAATGLHRIAVSFAGETQARAYFADELAGKTVAALAETARDKWNDVLSRVRVTGVDTAERRRFYSQLAQTFIQPRDRTADGIGWDDHYTLWDTWRTLFPLMALVDPVSHAANINAFADRFARNGRCESGYSSGKDYKVGQGGDEVDYVIADAWAKRIPGIDWTRVVPLLESRWNGRTRAYRERGYAVNGDREDYCRRFKSGSATMSFACQDWCCAQVLAGLGRTESAARFRARSGNWTNMWDVSAVDAKSGVRGFVRARLKDGAFTKTDPREGFNTDFYEANSWEYSFFVPHDIPALIARCGGPDAFRARLSYALENGLADFGNEPSFLLPWLFAYVGRGDLVTKWAREVAALFRGDDLPGDNDSGAMSALYVFLKLGFFPIAGQDIYVLHGSAYPRIDLTLGNGKTFTVRRTGDGTAVACVKLNGKPHDALFLRHAEIMSGGELEFVMK